ncbi:MAG TPA: hypothetical protein VNZ27_10345 [Rhodanobacter sp.]|jgi:hypothetical protein|nr:hypothetical protein [Rhodanobacter sp.]
MSGDTAMTSEIEDLAGQFCRDVKFTEDYVCLVFDRAVVNAYTLPLLEIGDLVKRSEDGDYQSALLGLVNQSVTRAKECPEDRLRIEFINGAVLIIPIDDLSRSGIEAAWYYEPRGSISRVW